MPVDYDEEPARPEDYDLVMWFDFTPMRIDDYYRQDARRWTEALMLRSAAMKGIERAKDEKRASMELLTMPGG